MSWNMIGSICKNAHEVAHLGQEMFSRKCLLASIFDQSRHDAFDSLFTLGQLLLSAETSTAHLVNNAGAICIVSLEDICAHERENGHNILHDWIWNKLDKLGDERQCLIGSCRIVGDCDKHEQRLETRDSFTLTPDHFHDWTDPDALGGKCLRLLL